MHVIDIEYTHLLIIGNGFDLNLNLPTSYTHFIKSDSFFNLLGTGNQICKHLHEKHNLENWIDIENELKIISKHFANDFESEFYDLCEGLKQHLSKIDYSHLNKDSQAYKLISEIINHQFLILDFNYTKSTEIILKELGVSKQKIEDRLIKVHGTLDEEIIFGVEDDAQIRPEHIFLKKSYNESFKAINLKHHLGKINQLYIFGHSLGATDHMYLKSFFSTYSHESYYDKGKIINLYFHGKKSYKDLHIQISNLCNNNLTGLKQNNEFILLDTSK